MSEHVCSNKIVYFAISLPAVASSLSAKNITVAFFLRGLGECLQPLLLHLGQALALQCLVAKQWGMCDRSPLWVTHSNMGVKHCLVLTGSFLPGLFVFVSSPWHRLGQGGGGVSGRWCLSREVALGSLQQMSCPSLSLCHPVPLSLLTVC